MIKKRLTILILTILLLGSAFGQTDKNGNPVLNSVSIGGKTVGKLILISNYYTLKNNIDNKQSSVYVSQEPTLDQIGEFAMNITSDFFILTKKSRMVVIVALKNEPKREFLATVMKTNKQLTFPCTLIGDITENRANELVKEKYDSTAYIKNGVLKFNGKDFKIILNKDIDKALLSLIKKEKLDKNRPSNIKLTSASQIKTYILIETKKGGKLDYFTKIKGKEFDGVQIKPGVFTTKGSIALYKWGRACFSMGVNTVEDAYEIFSEFKQKEITRRDKGYIQMGFNKEWED